MTSTLLCHESVDPHFKLFEGGLSNLWRYVLRSVPLGCTWYLIGLFLYLAEPDGATVTNLEMNSPGVIGCGL